ncbi:MAG: prepilin-type N-terminal cleavage/methylation domain-containing protein [Candidatus Omnitrophica bacterium]|nr:prepilin-type N-terminal cleavage/methylation domain-containing protein [Candidatus Omnitrophota bacterium]
MVQRIRNRRGFTLVEIMIVVAIIGLLAAIAIPNFVQARRQAQTNACINNLRQIDYSKEQLALANNLGTGAAVAGADITGYIKGGWANMTCPFGGVYTPQPVDTPPTCSAFNAVEHNAVLV